MRCLITNNQSGRVIGKGGANVRQIRDDTGANVHMNDTRANDDRQVDVTGPSAAVIAALQTIVDMIGAMPPEARETKRPLLAASTAPYAAGSTGYAGAAAGYAGAGYAGYYGAQTAPVYVGTPHNYASHAQTQYRPPFSHSAAYAPPSAPTYPPNPYACASARASSSAPSGDALAPAELVQMLNHAASGKLIGRGGQVCQHGIGPDHSCACLHHHFPRPPPQPNPTLLRWPTYPLPWARRPRLRA